VPDAGPTSDAASATDGNCGLTTVKLEARPPEIMMVFDRSSSMNMIVRGTMNSRFTEASAAITDVLAKTNATVLWGLKLYPTGAMMCNINPGVEVPVGAMTGPAVTTAITGAVPGMPTGTPTHVAVMMGADHLKARTTTNPKYILLVTDGEPNCVMGGGGGTNASVTAIQAAAAAGFHTFVVGIATAGTGADTTLNDLAMAGGEARMGATKYYPATLRDELVTVLTQITGQVTNCIFPLGMQPPSPNDVAVRVGNTRIERNMMNGWEYGMGMQSVVLYGAACELAKSGKAGDVQIIFGCPNVPIP
jgi:von Willebrand factor type A domain-containing protein